MAVELEEPVLDVEEALGRTEHYIQENKKSLGIILGAVVLLILAFFAWKYLYMKPLAEEAQSKVFWAEKWFEKDSLNLAINGHGDTLGFARMVDEYGNTPSGNLSHYYLGICYRAKGNYKDAIKQFQDYDGNDLLVGTIATGSIGDCYMEEGNAEEAITYYLKAASQNNNAFTSPIYLKKAGLAYEDQKNYAEAVKVYQKIKTEFNETTESRDIDKFIARAKVKGNIN
ncbi:MAG TPA: tetratricopeptide repeat protein [Bacteroidia bacterium]|jgi:tetratricopeptide (TPR) repeat protein|nr:tetratricopeptide repeat protein [Bacteroidia bacterium]